ncbi:hypothetical protein GO485_08780 [Pseudoduganella flava]|uniref:Transposase n=1 Tax=Pseudoduganella flava TaxID=871742 RepID=A0ABX6FRK9_9BURK|nr:hypothetical protein GO485_08780 [Pseudoduganella flava]
MVDRTDLGRRDVTQAKAVRTKVVDAKARCPPDQGHRQFKAQRTNHQWGSDFIHISNLAGLASWFNHRRLLDPLGYIPPAKAEANC